MAETYCSDCGRQILRGERVYYVAHVNARLGNDGEAIFTKKDVVLHVIKCENCYLRYKIT